MTVDPLGSFQTHGCPCDTFAEKNPELVKRLEHHVFRLHVGEAVEALRTRPSLQHGAGLNTHRRLFADFYPRVGQDCLAILPHLAVGKAGRHDIFAHPQDIQRAVERCLSLDRDIMRPRPGEMMGLLACEHPCLGGDGRVPMTVHADLSRRAGIHVE